MRMVKNILSTGVYATFPKVAPGPASGAACFTRRLEYPCCNGSGVILGAVLRPRIHKNSGGPVVSPSLSSSSPHGERARERTGLPSNATGRDVEPPSFEYNRSSKEGAKNDASGRDVEPPSFEYTHCSKEGAKNDAPPNEQRPLGSPIGKGVERRLSRRRLGEGVLCAPVGSGVFLGADWEGACFARPLERRVLRAEERRPEQRLLGADRGGLGGDGSPPYTLSARRIVWQERRIRGA